MKSSTLLIMPVIVLISNSAIGQNKYEYLKINRSMTLDQIQNLDGIDLINEVFMMIALQNDGNRKPEREFIDNLPYEQKMLYAIWVLDINVKNGGFEQYYHNTNGGICDISFRAAREIMMDQIAEIIQSANEIFFATESMMGDIRFSDNDRKKLSELDREYYIADYNKYIYTSLVNYIRTNKEKFIKNRH